MPRKKPSLFGNPEGSTETPRIEAMSSAPACSEPTPAKRPIRPAPDRVNTKRNLRVSFTEAELLAKGRSLAEATGMLTGLENDKKRVVADFSAKIAGVVAEIQLASTAIATGYEFRMVPCTEWLGEPEPGKKSVYRDDTGLLVGVEEMTQADLQRQLPV
jgi:hypothetical protein